MKETDKTARLYVCQGVAFVAIATCVCCVFDHALGIDGLCVPAIVSGIYALVVEIADAVVWRKVKNSSPDSLPTFFMGVSMARLFTAVVTVTAYYFATGRAPMLKFFLVFMAFYLVILVHHSAFFARQRK